MQRLEGKAQVERTMAFVSEKEGSEKTATASVAIETAIKGTLRLTSVPGVTATSVGTTARAAETNGAIT